MEIVHWYCKIMEGGINTRDIAKNFYELQQELVKVKKSSSSRLSKLGAKNLKLTKSLDETLKSLKKQQDEVVRPMIEEVSKREVENLNLIAEIRERTKNLNILFAIIRSPKMCDILQKIEKKRESQEKSVQLD